MQVVLKINDLRKTNGNYTVPARSVPPRPKRESFAVGRQQAALPFVFPHVPVQRCWAHKLRSIADKVSRQEGSCVAGAAALYRAISKSEALRAFREVRRRTRPMSSFSNMASCDRIVYGVTSHLNRSWERKPLFKFTQNPLTLPLQVYP